jgi:thioredoxin-like negative regulator of GroEL
MAEDIKKIDSNDFAEVIKESDRLVIIEFYSDNCSQCRAIAPVYSDLSRELKDYALFTQLDVVSNIQLSQELGVMGTPTFKFFCAGRAIGEIVGAINATILRNTIKDMVRHKNECITKSTPINYEMDGYM